MMETGTKNNLSDPLLSEAKFPDFLAEDSSTVARKLLGCYMIREFSRGEKAVVRIVETESYDQADEASHTFRGRTARNNTMFGPSGHWYVYFTYGMHYCCNIATSVDGFGSGVLIRAVEPVEGVELIEMYRGKSGILATNGPAKLCQALQITRALDGHDATQSPLQLAVGLNVPDDNITVTTRIGISKAKDDLRRWYVTDSPYVSVRSH